MTVVPGSRFGPYEIISRVGAGGMGEVWRARDTRLDRSVAIKILASHLSGDAQFRERFEREARSISSLSHPNICTLHDIGHEEGAEYLVMEYLEGESLADRLARGPLPIDEVLRVGIQIAEALDRAHRAGIVHRDVKPGNVFLTKSGAKLLDFGLAKLTISSTAPAFSGMTVAPTQARPLTQEGTIVGTFQYMSPEQLEGADTDPRSDIFALGAILYEMATGRRAFDGKTRTSVIAAIVSSKPTPISELMPLTPPALDHVVERCLAKDPADRWQSARDVAEELKWVSAKGSQAGVAAPLAIRRKSRERMAWLLAGVFGLALIAALVFMLRPKHVEPLPVVRVDLNLNPPVNTYFAVGRQVALSPDGRRLAYVAQDRSAIAIVVRTLDRGDAITLPGTTEARSPFFSPDSQWIAFFNGSGLTKVPAEGGPPQLVTPFSGNDAHWEDDGTILIAGGGIHSVSAAGGTPQLLVPIGGSIKTFRAASYLPGHKKVLFCSMDGVANYLDQKIGVYDLGTKQVRFLRAGSNVRYLPTGHLLYYEKGTLYLVPFDPEKVEIGANPTVVAQNVLAWSGGLATFDVSRNGLLAYATGGISAPMTKPVWVDRKGVATDIGLPARSYEHPRISPDGKHAAFDIREQQVDVWVYNFDRGTLGRLTFAPPENETPIWSPDGRRILFSASRAGRPRTHFAKNFDGTGVEEPLIDSTVHGHVSSISPDGKTILYTQYTAGSGSDLWSWTAGKSRVLMQTPFDESAARFSPDGRWIAYASNESGRTEVYVIAANGGGRWQASTSGGFAPVWSHDGHELFYRNGNDLCAVDVQASDTFVASVPHVLFSGEFQNLVRGDADYDVSNDGRRFLMLQRDKEQKATPVILVTNWFEELKRLTAPK
ncbi:MAG TPA: protein kinase [Thermoanaerobaculia bacterium]